MKTACGAAQGVEYRGRLGNPLFQRELAERACQQGRIMV
jgi:hypothetical protein